VESTSTKNTTKRSQAEVPEPHHSTVVEKYRVVGWWAFEDDVIGKPKRKSSRADDIQMR
jgi:hypothetical protein